MTADSILQVVFVVARFVHFTACMVVPAVWAIDRLVVARDLPDEGRRDWHRIRMALVSVALPAALLSGAVWIVLVAMTVSGQPFSESIDRVLPIVWHRMEFGRLWQIRSVLWCAVVVCCVAATALGRFDRRGILAWLALACSLALVGTLAWAGHGRDSSSPNIHLIGDAMHLCLGALWPAGLFPFALHLLSLRRIEYAQVAILLADATRRFSTISLLVVPLLLATGLVNTCMMLPGPIALFQSEYGIVLLAKIVLVLATIAIGAVNLRRHRPALASSALRSRDGGSTAKLASDPASALVRNVIAETLLTVVVLALVAILGLLPPPH